MTKRERCTFTPEFKKQMVQLHQNGKSKKALIKEYDLTRLPLTGGFTRMKNPVPSKRKTPIARIRQDFWATTS
jgi:hypothetical protein